MSHLELDALADVLAGQEQPEHLASCAQCQTQLSDLAAAQVQVSAALSGLATPPIPDSLVARLSAALAAEPAPFVATGTVVPLSAARSRRTPWLATAGGVAAAGVIALGVVTLRSGGGASSDSTALGSAAGLRSSSTGNDYTATSPLLAQSLPGLLSGTATKTAQRDAVGAPEASVGAEGSTGSEQAPVATQALAPDPLAPLRTRAALAACLAGLTEPGDTTLPLALDYAAFNGQPALVVVYPATKPGKVDVFVVGAGCSQADSTLLFFTRLSRP